MVYNYCIIRRSDDSEVENDGNEIGNTSHTSESDKNKRINADEPTKKRAMWRASDTEAERKRETCKFFLELN